jgi:hypothetical protein
LTKFALFAVRELITEGTVIVFDDLSIFWTGAAENIRPSPGSDKSPACANSLFDISASVQMAVKIKMP